MKHQMRKYKLGRTREHREALWYNLFRSLILHGKIITTYAKAASVIPIAEKYITIAKNDDLASYRRILSFLRNDEIVAKKLLEIGKEMKDRNGGYLRKFIMNARLGDAAKMACIMLVREN